MHHVGHHSTAAASTFVGIFVTVVARFAWAAWALVDGRTSALSFEP